MAEALGLDRRGPCWRDPASFRDLSRISAVTSGAPHYSSEAIELLLDRGVDISVGVRRDKQFASAVASVLDQLFAPAPSAEPRHSDAIVVVDKDGDIAVATHTINTVIWGDTGLVVGGVPLLDSAGIQQARLAQIEPGARLPNEIACTLTFNRSKPVLATAPIGSSLLPETLKTIVSVIGQKQDLADVVGAPPLLANFDTDPTFLPIWKRPISVPPGAYDEKFLAELTSMGVSVTPEPRHDALRGTLAAVTLDPRSREASSPEVARALVFAAGV